MSRSPIRQKDIENPERILSQIINDYIQGRLGGVDRVIHKASVVEIDHVGSKLAGPNSVGSRRSSEPPNPKGSIVARLVTDSADTWTEDDDLLVFWPMFPFDLSPLKETEHVYVIFEDPEQTHGMWLSRVPDPAGVHNLNITPGTKRFTSDSKNGLTEGSLETERIVQDLDKKPSEVVVTSDFRREEDDVPELNARVGDRVIQGSNNTAIILSRDRKDVVSSGKAEKAGSVDIVAGRSGEDLDMINDKARITVSMKGDTDANFALEAFGPSGDPDASTVLAKADEVRLVARENLKIVVESGKSSIVISNGNIVINCDGEVHLGGDPAEDWLAGATATRQQLNSLRSSINGLVLKYNAHVHPAPGGATSQTVSLATPPKTVGEIRTKKTKAT